MQKLDIKAFDQSFYESLYEKLEIEGKSIFAYFPHFFSADELTSVIKEVIVAPSDLCLSEPLLVHAVCQAHIFTQLSLKIHLISKLKEKDSSLSLNWLEYAILAGDYFGGRYINAFLERSYLLELKQWLEGLKRLNQSLSIAQRSTEEAYNFLSLTLKTNALELLGYEINSLKIPEEDPEKLLLDNSEVLIKSIKRLVV